MQHTTKQAAILLLSDGTIFHGKSIGISGTTFGEVCLIQEQQDTKKYLPTRLISDK